MERNARRTRCRAEAALLFPGELDPLVMKAETAGGPLQTVPQPDLTFTGQNKLPAAVAKEQAGDN